MKISVVVTTYNYAHFLPDCLESLLAQDFDQHQYEIVLVDDCSSDNTQEVLRHYQSSISNPPQFRVIINADNMGGAATANIGINAAQGDCFVRVDADDYVSPTLLSELYRGLQRNPEALGCACDYQIVDMNTGRATSKSAVSDPVACGILHRRQPFISLGGYNPHYRFMEEEEIRKRLGKRYSITHVEKVLYYYRKHGNNKTSNLSALADYQKKLDASQPLSC